MNLVDLNATRNEDTAYSSESRENNTGVVPTSIDYTSTHYTVPQRNTYHARFFCASGIAISAITHMLTPSTCIAHGASGRSRRTRQTRELVWVPSPHEVAARIPAFRPQDKPHDLSCPDSSRSSSASMVSIGNLDPPPFVNSEAPFECGHGRLLYGGCEARDARFSGR